MLIVDVWLNLGLKLIRLIILNWVRLISYFYWIWFHVLIQFDWFLQNWDFKQNWILLKLDLKLNLEFNTKKKFDFGSPETALWRWRTTPEQRHSGRVSLAARQTQQQRGLKAASIPAATRACPGMSREPSGLSPASPRVLRGHWPATPRVHAYDSPWPCLRLPVTMLRLLGTMVPTSRAARPWPIGLGRASGHRREHRHDRDPPRPIVGPRGSDPFWPDPKFGLWLNYDFWKIRYLENFKFGKVLNLVKLYFWKIQYMVKTVYGKLYFWKIQFMVKTVFGKFNLW